METWWRQLSSSNPALECTTEITFNKPDGLVPIIFQKCCWSTFIFTTSQPSLRSQKEETWGGRWEMRSKGTDWVETGERQLELLYPLVNPANRHHPHLRPRAETSRVSTRGTAIRFVKLSRKNHSRCGERQMLNQVHQFGRKKTCLLLFRLHCFVLTNYSLGYRVSWPLLFSTSGVCPPLSAIYCLSVGSLRRQRGEGEQRALTRSCGRPGQ